MKRIILTIFLVCLGLLSLGFIALGLVVLARPSSLYPNLSPIGVGPSVPRPLPTPTPTPILKRKLDGGRLFNLVNDYRTEQDLSSLAWYHPLCDYAKKRSEEIKTDFSHAGFFTTWEEASAVCPECQKAGENLAEGYLSEEAVLEAWIKSPTHKENLDGPWTWGCVMFYDNNFVSMIFGQSR